jgi:hypothetical protein
MTLTNGLRSLLLKKKINIRDADKIGTKGLRNKIKSIPNKIKSLYMGE